MNLDAIYTGCAEWGEFAPLLDVMREAGREEYRRSTVWIEQREAEFLSWPEAHIRVWVAALKRPDDAPTVGTVRTVVQGAGDGMKLQFNNCACIHLNVLPYADGSGVWVWEWRGLGHGRNDIEDHGTPRA
jgi:hypothetical protein